jgi:hypothetical protein
MARDIQALASFVAGYDIALSPNGQVELEFHFTSDSIASFLAGDGPQDCFMWLNLNLWDDVMCAWLP